jgi:hypothetical protein
VRLAWEHLRVRAGSDDLHFHDLRHEAVSRLLAGFLLLLFPAIDINSPSLTNDVELKRAIRRGQQDS